MSEGQAGGALELELAELRRRYVPRGLSTAQPMIADHASGSEVWDTSGRRYLDFAGGIGVMNVGHGHPKVLAAASEQLGRFTHTCFQVLAYEPYLRLAERLCEVAPGDHQKKAIFLSTGAEAVENAVKVARSHTGRPGVVSFAGGFHGRTLLALSLTGSVEPYKQAFGPYAGEVYQVPFPYEYRGWSSEQSMAALEDLFRTQCPPERIAAVIIEPVLGEGGFVQAPAAFLRELRALTERHGIVLIDDEVQTGFGRTGRFFAIEHAGVVPDLVLVAKSLAAGFPLSAVIGRAEMMDAPAPGGLGGTYAGNPVACAAGLAVMDVMRDERLPERGARIGETLRGRMGEWAAEHELVGDVRVLGAMAGLELVRDRARREPAEAETARVIARCREEGLVVLRAGMHHNVIRTLMPLNIPDAQLEEGLDILGRAVAEVDAELMAGRAR